MSRHAGHAACGGGDHGVGVLRRGQREPLGHPPGGRVEHVGRAGALARERGAGLPVRNGQQFAGRGVAVGAGQRFWIGDGGHGLVSLPGPRGSTSAARMKWLTSVTAVTFGAVDRAAEDDHALGRWAR